MQQSAASFFPPLKQLYCCIFCPINAAYCCTILLFCGSNFTALMPLLQPTEKMERGRTEEEMHRVFLCFP
ncbi:hypothetical protein SLEP1_g26937 [Rubroshorea leprosula]|uniref:Uncharacterized protein n=1 Tax=Rubroshorea leprosula TaxID=152421 RepID=A0AAV5JNJ9_9ROSI|nr:hypothetical protein SLEP1_g26937 [Rubroshorea leprosula]